MNIRKGWADIFGYKKIKDCNAVLLFMILCGISGWFVFRYLIHAILPFIFAWGVAFTLEKPTKLLSRKAKIPKKYAAVVTVSIIAFVLGYLFFIFFTSLSREVKQIYEDISVENDSVEQAVQQTFDRINIILEKIPYFGEKLLKSGKDKGAEVFIVSLISRSAPQILTFAGSVAARLMSSVPQYAFFLIVTVISSFYFCCDLDVINRSVIRLFPDKVRKILLTVKDELFNVVFGYVRAYLILISITFTQLYIGFYILEIRYALLLSLLISFVDILPILGVGTILLPWALGALVFNETKTAVCLIVLYFIITVIRQFAEPRIVGKCLDLHPLLALASIYAGARLLGLPGIFIFPIFCIVARNVSQRLRCEKSDH